MTTVTLYVRPGWTGCRDAQEFLAHRDIDVASRNIFSEPLSRSELKDLGARAGGIANLIAPTKRAGTEEMSDTQIVEWLAEDPARLRRPIIDTGAEVLLGFTKSVRERLA